MRPFLRNSMPALFAAFCLTLVAWPDNAAAEGQWSPPLPKYSAPTRTSAPAPFNPNSMQYDPQASSQAMQRSNVGQHVVQQVSAEQPVDSAAPRPIAAREPAALPLEPPSKKSSGAAAPPKAPTPARALTTVFGSLAIVLGLFFLVVWVSRRALPKAATSLPKEVVEVLGRLPLGARQQMQVVRFGNKLVLLHITANGAESLAEITAAEEVERLCGICQQAQPGSVSASFRQVISQISRERPS